MRAWIATLLFTGIPAGCSSSTKPASPTAPAPAHGEAPAKPAPGKPAIATDAEAPKTEIVTAEILKMNGTEYGRPGATWNSGSVAPIAAPRSTRTATGFQVQFASHATITTPTVYERKVLVSGGFQGKELYAYEAGTGKPLWGIDLHDDGPSSPACEDGVCVVNTESCTIFAISAQTGKHLWSYWLGDPLTSAPTIAGGRVFASYPQMASDDPKKPAPPGANHALVAFDLRTGKVQWQLWLDSDVMSAPVAAGDFVYVTTFNGTMIKAEQATGKVRYAMKAKATSAPVVLFGADGVEQMYYTRREAAEAPDAAPTEMVIRADHNEPQTKWHSAKKPARYIDKKAQADSSYNASSKSQDAHNGFGDGAPASAAAGYAFDNVGVNSVASMQGFQGSRVVHLADKNVNTMGDEVIATDNETGAVVWKYKLAGDMKQGGFLGTAPLAAGSHVLVGTLQGQVLRLDPKTGKSTASYAVGGPVRSQPVVADGWIYVGTEDGKLVAIDTKDPSITGWPTWGGNAQRTGIPH
ncbi:MAG TPA: PQQ-binding-like beta-propeller repeat protein [Kofleriaceae bacterium]|jgi:outer membrane protein assembly factor BamB|nr:PQQ-binding-like beta-propeller repeat protein [Kofleriaceae bacterium]